MKQDESRKQAVESWRRRQEQYAKEEKRREHATQPSVDLGKRVFIGFILLIIGIVLLLVSIVSFIDTTQFVNKSRIATGVVVDFETEMISTPSPIITSIAVIEFNTGSRFVRFNASGGENYNKGSQLIVIYNPESPEEAKIKSFISIWGLPLFVGLAGLITFSVGVAAALSIIK